MALIETAGAWLVRRLAQSSELIWHESRRKFGVAEAFCLEAEDFRAVLSVEQQKVEDTVPP